MPNTHVLIKGGQRVNTQTGFGDWLSMFPATEQAKTDVRCTVDDTQHKTSFSMKRTFDFAAGAFVSAPNIPASLSPEAYGSTALNHYVKNTAVIANGDTIVTHQIPHGVVMVGCYVEIHKALAGFTFDLHIRGQSASVGGAKVIASGISGAAVGAQWIDFKSVAAVGNVDVFFNENDALELVITALPANTTESDGSNGGGIIGSAFSIVPVVYWPMSSGFF